MELNSLLLSQGIKEFIETFEFRVVRSLDELKKAYSLVYREYLKRGYATESPLYMKFSIHNALPQTLTFIVATGTDVIATATLVPDSPLGLPMEDTYGIELMRLREKKLKLCEITMLATHTALFREGRSLMLNAKKLFMVFNLFKVVFDYVRIVLQSDLICVAIHPKHLLTYEYLSFKELGGLKPYKSANMAPAIARYLDVNKAEVECKKRNRVGLYKMFFARTTPPKVYKHPYRFTFSDLKYFFTEKSDIFKKLPFRKKEFIKSCYPEYTLSDIL